jgi:hypothetical protein
MKSHLQTRTLTDALDLVEAVLVSRKSGLKHSAQRDRLDACFAKTPYPRFFESWAFLSTEFEASVNAIAACAPDLAKQLTPPLYRNDFTVVGNCSLNLYFASEPNHAKPVTLQLRNGQRVDGAEITSSAARVYSSQLIEFPTRGSEKVYFYSPQYEPHVEAAEFARDVFFGRGQAGADGVVLRFPTARTNQLPDYSWVRALRSTCKWYFVSDFFSAGEALVDHNGFFARETQVVRLKMWGMADKHGSLPEVVIDGPFLIFLADDQGVHAAAWSDWDAFSATPVADRVIPRPL